MLFPAGFCGARFGLAGQCEDMTPRRGGVRYGGAGCGVARLNIAWQGYNRGTVKWGEALRS